MEFEARDASQTAQQANAEFYEELARDAIQVWGPDDEFDCSNIGEMLGYSKTGKTAKGVYAAIERLWRFEPDRWGDGQLAQEASKGASKGASSEAPMENEPEPALVLACLL